MRMILMSLLALSVTASAGDSLEGPQNLESGRTLYVVGYAHLDSQWRWTYQTTIDRFIKNTLEENFELLEKYPQYVFNFSGSSRYEMMKEYYPEHYERLKHYIAEKRWFPAGSSVDECDVLIPSPESVLRQILYGNAFFRAEFGTESNDFLLPDCFGFPAYMPSVWAHAGLLGFSTQKLTWGSAMGIPFNVGLWEGPDGRSITAALNATDYVGSIPPRLDINRDWIRRIDENGRRSGIFADYRYYGVGDMGGAPREEDVRNAIESLGNEDSEINVLLTSADRLYQDLSKEQKARLPKYIGELMLTEHSSGTMTSQAFMKRMNRKNELLADAAERAAVISRWLGATSYPKAMLNRSWQRVLVSQMHDILPGTAIPKAYEFAWNDEIIAANGFASVLTHSMTGLVRGLDTRVQGEPVVVYNPLAIAREDVAEATVVFSGGIPSAIRVYDPKGSEVPSQIVEKTDTGLKIIFLANVPAVGVGVYDVRPSSRPYRGRTELHIDPTQLENAFYRVSVNSDGDIAAIYDKQAKRDILARPVRLEFLRNTPREWPAWNMDWADRAMPPIGCVDGPARIAVVENGPVRATLEVQREANNSVFVQRISLTAGEGGKRIEVHNNVDWQSSACVLKASFPLTVHNGTAAYNQGLGVMQRPTNTPRQFEMLAREWFSLTDESGEYGVTILEDCKFGSDKPSDNEVRLTLLNTPGARHRNYRDQLTQDWGRHEFVYGLYGHAGNWVQAQSEWQGRRLNQPLRTFQADSGNRGALGKMFSMLHINTPQVDVRAMKMAETGDAVIVRLQELFGQDAENVVLRLGTGIVSAYEVDGQERRIGPANVVDGSLVVDMTRYAIRSFAVVPAEASVRLDRPQSVPVALDYNVRLFSRDGQTAKEGFGELKKTMPAEMIPARLVCDDVEFVMAPAAEANGDAVACRGQRIALPQGNWTRVYLLASADEDTAATMRIGDTAVPWSVQAWTGYIGQFDNRVWDRPFNEIDYNCLGWLTAINKGYIKRDSVAWFATHRHTATGENEAYQFSYIFKYDFPIPAGADFVVLPDEPKIKVFAMAAADPAKPVRGAADLYDNFDNRPEITVRKRPGDYLSGKTPLGTVTMERADSYDALTLCKPTDQDYADQHAGNGVEFRYCQNGYFAPPSRGGAEGRLIRLNDGLVGRNNDDLDRCTFFDNGEGRFAVDLRKAVALEKVCTYSWHRSDRAPQTFSLWAATEKIPLDADLQAEDGGGWTLIARVDTRHLGQGGVHASCVVFPKDKQYRYLMWVTDLMVQSTFFNEIDVFPAK